MSNWEETVMPVEERIKLGVWNGRERQAQAQAQATGQLADFIIALVISLERERILALINTNKDLVHDGYHGYAGKTPQPNCKSCQIEQALRGKGE